MTDGVKIFPRNPASGRALSMPGVSEGLSRMAKAWETLRVRVLGGGDAIVRWDNDQPTIELYVPQRKGDLDVLGTPGLFKAVTLTGWTKSGSDWTQMSVEAMTANPPTELWQGSGSDGNYLRPTWDYIRAIPEEEEE